MYSCTNISQWLFITQGPPGHGTINIVCKSPKYFVSLHENSINCVHFDYVYLYPGVTLLTRPWSQWSLQWCPMTTWRARLDWAASTAPHAQPLSTRGPGHTGNVDPLFLYLKLKVFCVWAYLYSDIAQLQMSPGVKIMQTHWKADHLNHIRVIHM